MTMASQAQASSLAAEPRSAGAISPSFVMKVFYVFAALALLSLAISVGGKWFGRSIALAGHTDDTTLREIVIRQQCHLRARPTRSASTASAATAWRTGSTSICAGRRSTATRDAARDDFNHCQAARATSSSSPSRRASCRAT